MNKIPQEVLDYYFPWGVKESDFSESGIECLVNSLGYKSYMMRKAWRELKAAVLYELKRISSAA